MTDTAKFTRAFHLLGILPKAYTSQLSRMWKALNDALAARAPALARRFGAVSPTPVAFTHVKLFDADNGRFLEDQTVIADKGRITALGYAATVKPPTNARTIDGTGKTLVPGLWDAHMHVADDTAGPMLHSIGVTSV